MMLSAPTSSRLATYMVRLAIRTWLGAGSPSAAATRDGAAICASDSTAQSAKNVRIRSPRPALKIAMTSRMLRAQFLRAQRGVKVTEVVLMHDGQAAGGGQPGREERLGRQLRALQHPHAAAWRPSARRPRAAGGTIAVTSNPYRAVSSSAMRAASAFAPQRMTWSRNSGLPMRGSALDCGATR